VFSRSHDLSMELGSQVIIYDISGIVRRGTAWLPIGGVHYVAFVPGRISERLRRLLHILLSNYPMPPTYLRGVWKALARNLKGYSGSLLPSRLESLVSSTTLTYFCREPFNNQVATSSLLEN
jgi:hypothetical protein